MSSTRHRILIIEDATGVANMYKDILSDEYDITICHSGEKVQSLINQHEEFDLAVVDIVLPPEEKTLTLSDCQRTGLRLMAEMIREKVCSRFYVITVLKDLRPDVEMLCQQAHAVVKFQYKLDSEPEELKDTIRCLLEQEVA